jgi:tripartite-type tricarboxylate transporter receptor subunit TctC
MKKLLALLALLAAPLAHGQVCPDKNIQYWQAFPAGGESDIAARHQQLLLKKRCPRSRRSCSTSRAPVARCCGRQLNQLPADGSNVAGVNLPHIVLQPMEGQVQYKLEDITPVYWFHYTTRRARRRGRQSVQDARRVRRGRQGEPGRHLARGSGLNSANHAAHERLNAAFGFKTTYVPFKGTAT